MGDLQGYRKFFRACRQVWSSHPKRDGSQADHAQLHIQEFRGSRYKRGAER